MGSAGRDEARVSAEDPTEQPGGSDPESQAQAGQHSGLSVESIKSWATVMSSCLFYCNCAWHITPALWWIPTTSLLGKNH